MFLTRTITVNHLFILLAIVNTQFYLGYLLFHKKKKEIREDKKKFYLINF